MNPHNKKSLNVDQYSCGNKEQNQERKINREEREFDKIAKKYYNLSFKIKI